MSVFVKRGVGSVRVLSSAPPGPTPSPPGPVGEEVRLGDGQSSRAVQHALCPGPSHLLSPNGSAPPMQSSGPAARPEVWFSAGSGWVPGCSVGRRSATLGLSLLLLPDTQKNGGLEVGGAGGPAMLAWRVEVEDVPPLRGSLACFNNQIPEEGGGKWWRPAAAAVPAGACAASPPSAQGGRRCPDSPRPVGGGGRAGLLPSRTSAGCMRRSTGWERPNSWS